MDKKFKETGHENVYMPMLIPQSLLQKEADNPFSKDKVKDYFEKYPESTSLTLENKDNMLSTLAALTYAKENGWNITSYDEYIKSDDYKMRNWEATKK